MFTPLIELTHRERAILLAVTLGRAEITCSCEPDLFIDGIAFCDQSVAHRLAREGLLTATPVGKPTERVRATLTDLGWAALGPARTGDNTAA